MAKKKLTLLDKTYRAGKVYDFFKNGSVVLAIGFVTFVVLCFSLGLFTDSKIGFIGCAILSGGFLCFHRARIYFGQIEGDYFMQFMDLEGAFSEQFCRDRDAAFFL